MLRSIGTFVIGLVLGYYLSYSFIWDTTVDFVKDNVR